MSSAARDIRWAICVTAAVVLTSTGAASAQATATINGRVVDQGDAVLPGVAITATNVNTGVSRVTVTSGEGVYSIPGLEPGL